MLEEKIDLLTAAIEKLNQTMKPKAKGKKSTGLRDKKGDEIYVGDEIVIEDTPTEEAEIVTAVDAGTVSFDALKDKIIEVASDFEDGRDRVKAIFLKLKVDTAADLRPEFYAECYALLAKEK